MVLRDRRGSQQSGLSSDRGDILTDTPQAVASDIKKVVNKDRDVVLVTAAPSWPDCSRIQPDDGTDPQAALS